MQTATKLFLIFMLALSGMFSACSPNNNVQFSGSKPALDESQSGIWTGHWVQNGEIGEMQLDIEIKSNKISGNGSDQAGIFTLDGNYDDQGSVEIIKIYTGAHTVVYTGLYKDNVINGDWKIFADAGTQFQTGIFQLSWN